METNSTNPAGIVKVSYTKSGDKQLHTQVFNSVKEAIPFLSGKQNALLFQMAQQNDSTVDWQLLPFGDYKAYKFGMFVKNNLLELGLLLVGLGFAINYTLKQKGIKLFVREGETTAIPVAVASAQPAGEPIADPPPTPEPAPGTKTAE